MVFNHLTFFSTSGCGDDLFGDSGEFTSPGFPSPYPNNAYCLWRIKVPASKKIQLTFESFYLEEHCNRDQVVVYDGFTTSQTESPIIGTYCSKLSRFSLFSSSNEMTVLFRTSLSRSRDGFRATYKAVSGGRFPVNSTCLNF